MRHALPPALLLAVALAGSAFAQGSATVDEAGSVYQLTKVVDRESFGENGVSSGSSHDQDSLIERVIAVRPDGLELEYDFPPGSTAEDRAQQWMLPLRVLRPESGDARILNSAELEKRITDWLAFGKLPRTACGQWIFTWNAFKIDCDTQSALDLVKAYDLRPGPLAEGVSYRPPGAASAAKLAMKRAGADLVFTGEAPIDAELVRQQSAQSDVVIGEISRKPVTLEAALAARSREQISGTVSVSLHVDAMGGVDSQTVVTKLRTVSATGEVENKMMTSVLSRKRVAFGDPRP